MRSNVNLQCAVAVESFTTVATPVSIIPVVMTTRDARYVTATLTHCQQTRAVSDSLDRQLCKFHDY